MITALALLLMMEVSFPVSQAIGLLSTSTCPNTRISIICTAKTNKFRSHIPVCQESRMSKKCGVPGVPVKKNASRMVSKLSNTARVNGAGMAFLNPVSIQWERFIVQIWGKVSSCQLSVVSYQLSVVSCRLRKVESGKWREDSLHVEKSVGVRLALTRGRV